MTNVAPDLSDARTLVFGAGGHAKSVISALEAEARWTVVGLLTESSYSSVKAVLGHAVLGDASKLVELRASGIGKAFVAIGDNLARRRISEMLLSAGFELINVVHPTAVRLSGSQLGAGTFVHALSLIGPECHVGRSAIVQPFVSLGHESRIGDYAQFSPGVHIGGQVRIGENCFFGPGAVVYPRVSIGDNVLVGANSVVNKDVPDSGVIVGSPARRRTSKPGTP